MTGPHNNTWFDFGDAAPQTPPSGPVDIEDVKRRLLAGIRGVLFHLLPNGKARGGKFHIGDVQGNRGESLTVEMKGPKAGMWHDFATGEGGDIIALWAAVKGFDQRGQFPALMADITSWLGLSASSPQPPVNGHQSAPMDDLGPATAKWDYHDRNGNLIARVYRHDPPGGKQFRPWDVLARRTQAPNPRPLYNIPGILKADRIVLVEGEKARKSAVTPGLTQPTFMEDSWPPWPRGARRAKSPTRACRSGPSNATSPARATPARLP
jgi:hypothetical protein